MTDKKPAKKKTVDSGPGRTRRFRKAPRKRSNLTIEKEIWDAAERLCYDQELISISELVNQTLREKLIATGHIKG